MISGELPALGPAGPEPESTLWAWLGVSPSPGPPTPTPERGARARAAGEHGGLEPVGGQQRGLCVAPTPLFGNISQQITYWWGSQTQGAPPTCLGAKELGSAVPSSPRGGQRSFRNRGSPFISLSRRRAWRPDPIPARPAPDPLSPGCIATPAVTPAVTPAAASPLCPPLSCAERDEGRLSMLITSLSVQPPPGKDSKRPPTLRRFGVEGFQR